MPRYRANRAPPIPNNVVIIMPPGSLPGMISLAIIPARNPIRSVKRKCIKIFFAAELTSTLRTLVGVYSVNFERNLSACHYTLVECHCTGRPAGSGAPGKKPGRQYDQGAMAQDQACPMLLETGTE